ncbi:MAG: UTP--glucose-1-phosphate uridylyltransferase, partial [Pirellula sp.]
MSHLAESLTSLEQLKSLFGSAQSHLLSHWQSLSQSQRRGLADQISQVDFDGIRREMGSQERTLDWGKLSQSAQPHSAVRLADTTPQDRLKAIDQGELAIASGKVAMVLVAGGQGTRLGFDLPKGMYPIGPISGRTLFQMHVDSLRGAMRRFGVSIPLLVMTGPSTHEPTIRYFQENGNLGLKPHELNIFQQGTMPAIDATTGKILMESTSSIALSPDGHGGIVMALSKT